MVKTPHFHSGVGGRWCEFDPWSGNYYPTCRVVWPKEKPIDAIYQRVAWMVIQFIDSGVRLELKACSATY